MVNKWMNDLNSQQNIYGYKKKFFQNFYHFFFFYLKSSIYRMLPQIQVDEEDSSLFLTDANRIVNLKLKECSYKFESKKDNIQYFDFYPLNTDVKGLIKKDEHIFSFSQ